MLRLKRRQRYPANSFRAGAVSSKAFCLAASISGSMLASKPMAAPMSR